MILGILCKNARCQSIAFTLTFDTDEEIVYSECVECGVRMFMFEAGRDVMLLIEKDYIEQELSEERHRTKQKKRLSD